MFPSLLLPANTMGLKGTVCYFQRYLHNYLCTRNVQELAVFHQRLHLTNPALATQTIYTSSNQLHLQKCPLKDTFRSLLAICFPRELHILDVFPKVAIQGCSPSCCCAVLADVSHAACSAAGFLRKPVHIYPITSCFRGSVEFSDAEGIPGAHCHHQPRLCPGLCRTFSPTLKVLVLPLHLDFFWSFLHFFLLIYSGTCEKGVG